MSARANEDAIAASDREIVSTRIFDAPRALVWRAWSDPEIVAHWWGPKGFANTFYTHEFRPGGRWRFTMHGPDGRDYENDNRFVEITAQQRIVFEHVAWPRYRATVTFEDAGTGKTRITFQQQFENPADYHQIKGIATNGNEENFDKFGTRLALMASDNDPIVLSRTYDAPRDTVWRAWTEAEALAQWFGPNGFRVTTLAFDCRPGGAWRWIFHGPDGTDYHDRIDYIDIVKPQRLVYSHSDDGEGQQPPFHVTVLFGEHEGRTTVTMRSQFATAAERARIVGSGALEGGKQTLERLSEHLQTPTHDKEVAMPKDTAAAVKPFVISRTFDAPRELVFAAFTEPRRMKEWWGPRGYKVIAQTMDLRPGGTYHYGMEGPDGKPMWGKFVFREVTPPERLVLVNYFSDAAGGVTRHPLAPTWPLENLSTFTFEDIGGKTKLTIHWEPINATEQEIATFNAAHSGMAGGWGGTFDQLAAYLATAKA